MWSVVDGLQRLTTIHDYLRTRLHSQGSSTSISSKACDFPTYRGPCSAGSKRPLWSSISFSRALRMS
jgi:hypothetical protein